MRWELQILLADDCLLSWERGGQEGQVSAAGQKASDAWNMAKVYSETK